MATERIGDMTLDELNNLIESAIDRHFKYQILKLDDKRSMAEINESIRRHRITPPPNAKSALQMLREDRDA